MAPEWGVSRDRWLGRQGESRFLFAFPVVLSVLASSKRDGIMYLQANKQLTTSRALWKKQVRILTRFGWIAVAELSLQTPTSGGAKLAHPIVRSFSIRLHASFWTETSMSDALIRTWCAQTVWREPPQWVEKTRGRGILACAWTLFR